MEKEVYNDVLEIVTKAIDILKVKEDKDVAELKELSDHTIHDCSIYQDMDSVQIALLMYSLYKLYDRKAEMSENDYKKVYEELMEARKALVIGDFGAYNKCIGAIFNIIRKVDSTSSKYILEIIDKAKITKGSKLFEHGLSIKRSAAIMGIDEWEMLNYIGNTNSIEMYKPGGVTAKKRLTIALELFQ